MKKLDEKKLRAFELRKGGLSYNKIAAILNIQKSTLAYWFKDIDWSRDIKKQLIEKAAKISVKNLQRLNQLKKHKFEKLYEAARQEADAEFLQLKNNQLFIKGRHKTKRLGHGVCSIHLSSKYLKAKILQWIELFREEYKFAGLV